MKTMIIIAIALAAMMVVAGAYLVVAQGKQANIPCSSCNNKCTEQSSCGSASCGALNGGACNCSGSESCDSAKCGGNCGIESCGCGCKG